MFGVTSALEKYQQIVRDGLRGCPGVSNIADNLIIHGKGIEEHDQCLFAVLDRLSGVDREHREVQVSIVKARVFRSQTDQR